MPFSKNDTRFMAHALRLAARGRFGVGANPLVGAVIVKNQKIIGRGWHRKFGETHAEMNALEDAAEKTAGATIYITLEPCAHFGKTPPCVEALGEAKIARAVVATLDPNPLVSGRGVRYLKDAGMAVEVGLLENEARRQNRGFIKRMTTKMPFVSAKIAMSIDGKVAMKNGESRWISGEKSRLDVQYLRAENQAILTGADTVLIDNPRLTVRLENLDVAPLRVVVDGQNRLQNRALNIFSADAETLVFNRENGIATKSGKLDLRHILKMLGERGINYLLLESGPKLVGAMLDARLIDELIIYQAPIFLGNTALDVIAFDIEKMTDKITLDIRDMRMVGDDIKWILTPKQNLENPS